MGIEVLLTVALMAGVVVAFTVFHYLLHRVPWTKAYPRERYRWPVWNWYALVVVIGLLTGLAANLYWTARTGATNFDEEGDGPEIEHIRGIDNAPYAGARSPLATPIATGSPAPTQTATPSPSPSPSPNPSPLQPR